MALGNAFSWSETLQKLVNHSVEACVSMAIKTGATLIIRETMKLNSCLYPCDPFVYIQLKARVDTNYSTFFFFA